MKVLYLDHTAALGGGELALLRLVEGLGDDVEATVVLAEPGPLLDKLAARGLDVRVLPLPRRLREVTRSGGLLRLLGPVAAFLGYVRALRALIVAEGFDVVHCNSLRSDLYGCAAARLAGVPVIWHARDRLTRDYLSPTMWFAARSAVRLLPSATVANSESTKRSLPRGTRDVVVVPSPVCSADDIRVARERTSAHRSGRPSGGPFTVLVLGRIAPWKGQRLAIDAFALLCAKDPDAQLLVVGAPLFGEDDYLEELRETTRALGIADRVAFTGFQDDVVGVVTTAHVLIHTSLIPEPFGQVVVQAMAFGTPVVAADEGGPSEVVHDGTNGLLARAGDPASYAGRIDEIRASPDLAQRLVQAGLQTAEAFTSEVVAGQVLRVYQRLAQERSRSRRSGRAGVTR